MDSDEVNEEQGSTQLKYLAFLTSIGSIIVALFSNVYDFIKENVGISEKTIASVETTISSLVGPLYNNLKDLLLQILVFLDDMIDKYAPSLIKDPLEMLDSYIDEHLADDSKDVLQRGLDNTSGTANQAIASTRSLVGVLGNPIESTQNLINTTTSLVTDNPVYQAVNTAADNMMAEAAAAGKKAALQSVYLSISLLLIPVIAQCCLYIRDNYPRLKEFGKWMLPYVERLCEWYNETIAELDDKGYTFFGYLPTLPINEMKTTYALMKAANEGIEAVGDIGDNVTNIVGGIPIVGGVAGSISSAAGSVIDSTTSLALDNPLTNTITSAVAEVGEAGAKAAVKSIYVSINLLLLPIIAEYCYKLSQYTLIKAMGKLMLPFIEKLCEWYNEKIDELDDQGYSFFGYLPEMPISEMKAAYKLVKTANAGAEAVGDAVGLGGDE